MVRWRCELLVFTLLLAGFALRPAPSHAESPLDSISSPVRRPAPEQATWVGKIPIIHVGIAPQVAAVELSSSGAWRIGVVGKRRNAEEITAGGTWRFTADGTRLRVKDHMGSTRDAGDDTLFAYPAPQSGTPMRVNGQPYRGEMLVFAAGGGAITVVNVVDMESYLRGVVPSEIGRAGPDRIEAVKAQAVAARSYTLAHMDRWRPQGFDLFATAADQVYKGVKGEREDVDAALRATCGVVAVHEGEPIQAFYSSTCGGITAEPDEVWGRPPQAYLKARRDSARRTGEPFCAQSPFYRWTEHWSGTELERILKETLPSVIGARNPEAWGPLTDLRLRDRSRSRRVERLEIVFAKETFSVGGDQIRWILRRPGGDGLRSALLLSLDVDRARGRVKNVRISGAGFGHGVGLCQFGALGMARDGYDYREILHFYYKGIHLVRAYDRWPG